MLPNWLSSWYQQHNVHQLQEPFHDQYEPAEEDGDWIEVITPNTKRHQPIPESNNHAVISDLSIQPEVATKALSRQERRAMARSAIREQKKQARISAMTVGRNRGLASSTCLPSSPLIAN
jgi:hypothetical protein